MIRLSKFFLVASPSAEVAVSKAADKNVLKPFVRLDKSRSLNKSGVGLGLAIVEDIINSHGGNIQLGKSKFNGLQVKISLPF